ncbi:efflux RND transporter periplasmic adaptor subunit [Maridesulfovibrio hydrothermalis]|uniref:Efflux transporter, RND family, MFP subunit n=1 Tax=Maridesulfovibrio hydrothermalis AM13 = DSM 14728 TaxID=1121451 RepID=L0R9Q2_9BACT|nr:efflux RND transporter periplasmic adaptor subunit [Maridesulfovibrio hydrothermalis]CCO23474.1 Efflux transporter, RND family, MFP subunit [Maridesulfovibrio hydrothermalis AM13 = DSM 14728]
MDLLSIMAVKSSRPSKVVFLFLVLFLFAVLSGCIGEDSKVKAAAEAVPVKVIKISEQVFQVRGEYVAQVQAMKTVEIRARVQGHLKERLFEEGQVVEKGQLLFIIDRRPYEEVLKRAEAELASSRATLSKAEKDYIRFKALFDQGAVSREEYDSKITDKRVYEANVSNAKAEVEQANLDLGFTKIYSPMKGLIGRTQVNLGSLIAKESTVLVTVSSIDPVYVNFSIPEKEYLFAVKEIEARKKKGMAEKHTQLQIILADGQLYNYNGTLNMADRAVDSSTGTLGLRAEFPNPDKMLRDGQYAKVVALLKVYDHALVVPSRAVLDVQGRKSLLTVAANGTVVEKAVQIDYSSDHNTVIGKGLSAGDLVIADGVNRIRPGILVDPEIVEPVKPVSSVPEQ